MRLWRLTGDLRCLELADRLLWNHYAMNRSDNGGYGHRSFVGDHEGPLLAKPAFTEAVWCCTFQQIAQAAVGGKRLRLAVWAGLNRAESAAFVFDLVTVPEHSPAAAPLVK